MNITTEQMREVARLVDEALKAGTYAGTMTTIGAIVIALDPTRGMEYLDEVPPCCDLCGCTDEEVSEAGEFWCGSCGSCAEHCEGYDTCPNWEESEVFELPGADAGF